MAPLILLGRRIRCTGGITQEGFPQWQQVTGFGPSYGPVVEMVLLHHHQEHVHGATVEAALGN